jgi:hypothetical protein
MRRPIALSLLALLALPLLACSGNAIIEPAEKTTKRAKAFLEKCQAQTPPDSPADLKSVYACITPEDACPEASSAEAKTELGYILDKGDGCGTGTTVYDVPCGPDLNAIDCCYVVRTQSTMGGCE